MASPISRVWTTAVVLGVAVLTPAPAAAHPFGDPQTVAITHDDVRPEVVNVTWRVGGPDDLTLLGVALGLLPGDRVKPDGTVDYRYDDPGVVGASDLFPRYLLDRISVSDGALSCTGVVGPVRALGLKGASAAFTCPAPVSSVTVAVRTLTDLNPAYRTLATGPTGQRAVYESGEDTHTWALTGAAPGGPDRGRSALLQIGAVLGGLLLLAVLVGFFFRRRRAA